MQQVVNPIEVILWIFSLVPMTCIASIFIEVRALFVLYHLLLRSPITDLLWKSIGSLPNCSASALRT